MKIEKKVENGIEYIYFEKELYAIILRGNFETKNITFFTPEDFSQQLGYLPHKKGNIIKPHLHNAVMRKVFYTNEVLFVKKGKVKVNFYNTSKEYIESDILNAGDFILLCYGGHGFEILEDTVMVEVKQGPFAGIEDKERFVGVEK